MEQVLKERIAKNTKHLKDFKKTYNHLANIRLLVLVVGIGLAYLIGQAEKKSLLAVALGMTVIAFIYTVRKHQAVKEQVDYYESMIAINEKYLKRLTEEWKQFEDTGEEMLDLEHFYAYDLDVLGQNSLFQKINTTHTWHGRQVLKETLLGKVYEEAELVERQKAIQELIGDLDFCQEMEGIVAKRKEVSVNPSRLLEYAKTQQMLFTQRWMVPAIYIIPYIGLGALAVGYLFNQSVLTFIGIGGMLLNYVVQIIWLGKINETKGMLSAMMYDLAIYKHIIHKLSAKTFKSPYLKRHVEVIQREGSHAEEGIRRLESLVNKANIAYQPIIAIPLNAGWLWDLKVVYQMEQWRKQYGEALEGWLLAIGEIESLISLSVLGHLEEVTFPVVGQKEKYIQAEALGHPLIAKEKRVTNGFTLNNEVFIITGSNMSGKTTFLRTIGMNLVLAYAGAPVLAKYMSCSYLTLCTSMRIRDDLGNGISTFYAELMRIQMIVEQAKKKDNVLFLIDEIFRGTNSVDRIIGAKSVVKGAKQAGAIGAITTHDLELCALADEKDIRNYHFTECYKEKEIIFDYQLKEGASTTTNAKYLMKMVGIELIE